MQSLNYEITTLENGIRVITETVNHVQFMSMGFWVGVGSRYENEQQWGITHFIEHMLFKGTERRTYRDIAEEMDRIGGQSNAFTGKECTCYYAKVIDEKISVAVDLLCDMFCHSVFDSAEMEKEKGVVLEEISMSNDSPEDVAHETISEVFFRGTPYSKTILGPSENIRALSREDIIEYRRDWYTAPRINVAAVGNFDIDRLQEELEHKLVGIPAEGKQEIKQDGWEPKPAFQVVKKEIEQVHVGLGLPGYRFSDPDKYAASVVTNILGGSMSSRLFQKIREELGMAYSVYCYPSNYTDAGMLSIYAGTSADNAATVVEMVLEELAKMRRERITLSELMDTKAQLRGNFILGQESTSAKMNLIGKNALLTGSLLTEEEILRRLDEVTMEKVEEAIDYLFDESKLTGVFVGMVEKEDALKKFFKV